MADRAHAGHQVALGLLAAIVWTLKAYGDAKARLKALEERAP